MKKNGILNSQIAKVLADMGHTDYICIGDCGLPIPTGVEKIDISLKKGMPSFLEVLEEVEKDMVVEKVILASEIKEENAEVYKKVQGIFSKKEIDFSSHEEFKKMLKNAKAVIRTGEATPYANILLFSGVNF